MQCRFQQWAGQDHAGIAQPHDMSGLADDTLTQAEPWRRCDYHFERPDDGILLIEYRSDDFQISLSIVIEAKSSHPRPTLVEYNRPPRLLRIMGSSNFAGVAARHTAVPI